MTVCALDQHREQRVRLAILKAAVGLVSFSLAVVVFSLGAEGACSGDDVAATDGAGDGRARWHSPDPVGVLLAVAWLYASIAMWAAMTACFLGKNVGPFRPAPAAPLTHSVVLAVCSILLFCLAWVSLALSGFESAFPERAAAVLLGITLLVVATAHAALANVMRSSVTCV